LGKNKEIGNKGESIAVEYLIKNGFRILNTNYRHGRFEIDIIGSKDDILVFFEVKTRKNDIFGLPEEAVDDKKISRILDCANDYILEKQWLKRIRFDIISITLAPHIHINHIQDAFF